MGKRSKKKNKGKKKIRKIRGSRKKTKKLKFKRKKKIRKISKSKKKTIKNEKQLIKQDADGNILVKVTDSWAKQALSLIHI